MITYDIIHCGMMGYNGSIVNKMSKLLETYSQSL